jgi:hypothetical protein
MQITRDRNDITTMRTQPVAPGDVIGQARMRLHDAHKHPIEVDVTAGARLASGVRDIHAAAMELIARAWSGGGVEHHGLVGFFRNGDAWDAYALLAPHATGSVPVQIWGGMDIAGFRPANASALGAIWQISHYGGDTRFGTPSSTLPPL